jgi:hypothetical protein
VDFASWQCIFPHRTSDKEISVQKTNTTVETLTMLAKFGPTCPSHAPEVKTLLERVSL